MCDECDPLKSFHLRIIIIINLISERGYTKINLNLLKAGKRALFDQSTWKNEINFIKNLYIVVYK